MSDNINYSPADEPRELAPKGQHKAVCVDIVDMGEVKNIFYKPDNEYSKESVHKVKLVWEIDRRKANGKPFIASKTYTLSLFNGKRGGNASSLYKDLSSWLGAEFNGRFESSQIDGRPALIFIKHEERKDGTGLTAKVASVDPDEDEVPYVPSGDYKRFVPREGSEDALPF